MQRDEVLEVALKAAAATILKYDTEKVETHAKISAGDLVTAADLASEKVIVETIQSEFPDDVVISEENSSNHAVLNEDNLPNITAWVVDPIDGTNNFRHGMSYSGVSIGYIVNGKIVLGGIIDPYRGMLYMAKLGEGATCNDKPIHVSSVTNFDTNTRVCTSNSMVERGTVNNMALFSKIDDVWADVLGSSVLIMSDVASGKLDLYFHTYLKPWDNAAGFLIVQEAGAKIVGLKGQPVSWLTDKVVMGNPKLVDEFIAKVNKN